jgi:type II secretory pathway component PulJ
MNAHLPIPHRRYGFTLMEMVLAMGVCVVVISAATAVFFGAVRLRETTLQAVGESLPVQMALDVMERDLKGAMAPTTNGVYSGMASGSLNGIFSGDFRAGSLNSPGISQTVALELYTTTGALRDNQPWGDIQRVTYELQPSRTGQNLVRSVARNVLATVIPTPEDQVLLPNVARINVDCLDRDSGQWRNTWDTTLGDTNLPVAVRVQIEMNTPVAAAERQPITLVVPLDMQVRTNQLPANVAMSGS